MDFLGIYIKTRQNFCYDFLFKLYNSQTKTFQGAFLKILMGRSTGRDGSHGTRRDGTRFFVPLASLLFSYFKIFVYNFKKRIRKSKKI